MSSNETLRKFMKTPVMVYKTTDKISTLMGNINPHKTGIWAFAVQNENGEIVGGIDLSSNPIPNRGIDNTIENIMIRDMPIFSPETLVEDAKYLMWRTKSTQRALIVENDKVIGMVSLANLPDKYRGVMSPNDAYSEY